MPFDFDMLNEFIFQSCRFVYRDSTGFYSGMFD